MKILAFGEILWDVFDERNVLGGAPLNFAAYCAMLGADAHIVSAVGDDELGRRALLQVESHGIKTEYTKKLSDKTTGKCIVTLNEKGIPSYNLLSDVAYDYIQAFSGVDADVFAFGSLALRGEENKASLRKILSENAFGEIFSDVNIRPPFYSDESIGICLENATMLKISDEELPVVCRYVCGEEKSIEEMFSILSERYKNLKLILITKGDKGAECYDCSDKKTYSCDARKVDAVSTVGAGDSFGATFLMKYFKTKDCNEALLAASHISGAVCAYEGAILPKLPE